MIPSVLDFTPPPIAPVTDGLPRPRWSVMIPTYNCAAYLRQTLTSVLAQDPGPATMQIEVVDDASTQDDPAAVVQEIGQGRVAFFRQPQNVGVTRNFNTCVSRSRGHLVHILHGDDMVLPGFYAQVEELAVRYPQVALLGTRANVVDENNAVLRVTPRVPALEHGGTDARDFYYGTPLQTPAVVVRRAFYEAHGGFLLGLVHTADMEMWSRAISRGGGVVTPEVLACYRQFATNDTGRLKRTAGNLRDRQRLVQLLAQRHADFDARQANRHLCKLALRQAELFRQQGDAAATQANLAFWETNATPALRVYRVLRQIGRVVGLVR